MISWIQELRTSLENTSVPLSFPAEWQLDIFSGGRTDSGMRISEMTALQASTVFACVTLVSGAMGFLKLQVLERQIKNGRISHRTAFDHELFDLLENEPNPEMSSFTFRQTLQCHRMLWGNGYAEIQRDNGNRVVAAWPRNPSRTRPYRTGAKSIEIAGEPVPPHTLIFKTTEGVEEMTGTDVNPDDYASERCILAADMLHIPGLSLDGRLASSVVQLARQAVGLALASEKYGAKFFGNGAIPPIALSHPGRLSKGARATLKQSWQEAYGGENAHRAAVLEEGLKVEKIGTDPDKTQLLELRKFQKEEICSIFLVPPHMVGATEKTNRANTEQIGIEFVAFTLSPHLEAWQQELKRKLFPRDGRGASNRFSARFETRPLTMPDAATRQAFYNSGKQWGWLSTNIILAMEQQNPVDSDWADGYWMPINMQDAKTAFEEPAQGPGPADPADATDPDKRLNRRYVRAYFRLFRDAFGRILARTDADSAVFQRAFLPVFETLAEGVGQLASNDFEYKVQPEEQRFITDYIEGMRKRFDEWKTANGDAEKVAERELSRAVRAISIEVYRAIATARAKKQLEELEEVVT